MNYARGESVYLKYSGRQTGLTDVKLDVYNDADTKIISGVIMTEIGNGSRIYSYKFKPARQTRTYVAVMDSPSVPARAVDMFRVGENEQTQALTTRFYRENVWTKDEKDSLVKLINKIIEKLESMDNDIEANRREVTDLEKEHHKFGIAIMGKTDSLFEKQQESQTAYMAELSSLKSYIPEYHKIESKKFNEKITELSQKLNKLTEMDRTTYIISDLEDLRVKIAELAEGLDDLKITIARTIPDEAMEAILIGKNERPIEEQV